MKLLAIFGLVALALASSKWGDHRQFSKGNTYEFEWKGQIVSGVPVKGSSSHSIQQIRAKVLLTFQEKYSILSLENVKITNGHKQLNEPRIISESSLEESQLTFEQRDQLRLPIRFRYHQGIITEITFSEEESTWSENIKRSVLNMLQMQLSPKNTQESNDYEDLEKYPVNDKKFFTVTERTLEGECHVVYTIVDGENGEKQVTKSLNFDKCPKRVDIRYGPRYSADCGKCEETDARPESQTVITYKVRGDEDFIINEVELKSEYIYTPFSKEQEMLATYVHQKMRLIKVSEAGRVKEPSNGRKSSLLYNFEIELAREKFWMNGDDEYKNTGFETVPKKELMDKYIRFTLASMEETEKDGVTLETNHNFARIVEVFRMCSEKEIREIHSQFWEKYEDARQNEKVQQLLADALVAAGTKNTIEHFVEKCEKKMISPIRAALIVKGLVNVRTPSEKIVYALMRLAKSKVCREEPALRQSVLLTVGALMNGVCAKNNRDQWAYELIEKKEDKECRRELKSEWIKEWKNLFESATTRYEKILIIKALGNSALDMSVQFLEKIMYDRQHPISVRQAAVDALRLLREQMPKKVQAICLPLFKSHREPVSLRISALYQLVHSRPTRALLDQIVHQLNQEPSLQLRSFGVTLLRSLAESKKNPCEIKLAEDINVSLRMLRPTPLSTSSHAHLPWYSKMFDFGVTMDLASVFSNDSILPHELLASFDSVFAGQWNKQLVQFGVFQNNLDNVILPLLKKMESNEVILRGNRNSKAPLRDVLKSIVNQMKIQARDSNDYKQEDAYGMMYIRYKNLDYALVPVEEELMAKMIKDSNSLVSTSEIIRQLTRGHRFEGMVSGFIYEHVRLVPTTFGLPLQVTSKMPTVASIRSNLKLEISPKMSLRVEMEPSIVSTHVTEMTVFAPEMHLGARVFHSIQSTIPFKGHFEYNYEKQSIKSTLQLPKEEKRVLLVESRPTTFVRSLNSKQIPVLSEKTIRIPAFEKTSVHYEKTYGEELFGLKAEIVGAVHRRVFEKKSPESILFGENHVQIVLIPTERSMTEVILEIEPKYTKSIDEMDSFEQPRFDETFTEEEFGLETSDESDETNDERQRRRTHSKKYYESMKSLKGVEGRVNFRLTTRGGPKELKGEMMIKGSCDEEIKVCRFNIDAKRSPICEKERRDWTLEMDGQVVLPESPKSIKELKEMNHKEVEAKLNCKWGAEEKNEITVRLQKTQSAEMARLLKNIDYETKGLEQRDLLKETSKLNKYTILVEKELTKENEKTVRRLFDLVKSEFFMAGEVESVRTDSRKIKLEAIVEPEDCRRVNFTIDFQGEKLIVKEAYSPIRIPLMSLGSRRPSFKSLYNKDSWTSVFMPKSECEVTSNKVDTFDGLVYKTPLTTCYSVLAKDCSRDPEYIVMMKKMNKRSEEKTLKIVTEDREIICEPKDEKIVCKIDGRRVEDEDRLQEIGIKLIGDDSCEIKMPKLSVRFDGFRVEIKADKRTENTQCGLCGHFDGRRDNEFRRADNQETEDLEDFHRSWLSRDDECEIEDSRLTEKKNYGVESDEEERYDSEERFWSPMRDEEIEDEEYYSAGEKRSKKMLKKTLNKHINRKNFRDYEENTYEPEEKVLMVEREGKMCFSMEKQPVCEGGDEMIETEYRKVKLACLPRNDRQTRRLVNALKRNDNRVNEEIFDLSMSLTDRLEVPKLCRVY